MTEGLLGEASAPRLGRAPASSGADPLREAVWAGRFFGAAHRGTAARLAAFATGKAGPHGADVAEWFGAEAAASLLQSPDRLRSALDRDIARLDAMIAEQLDAVLHAARLQRLEGRWRGLHWLVGSVDLGQRLKVRVLDVGWAEVCRDLDRAAEFDRSNLFRRVYEDEFGMPGGEPFGLLVVDHEVRHQPAAGAATDDVGALAKLSAVCAAAFVPAVVSAHPALLEVDGWGDLGTLQDVAAPLRDAGHARWRGLAGRADMRFLAVTLPRLLARRPWGDDPARQDSFRYREHAPDAGSRVWMSAGYAFAACVLRAGADHGWPADVRGAEADRIGGGLVTDVPREPYASGPDSAWGRLGVEVQLADRHERALVDHGLMPVSALPYGAEMVFGAARSLQTPARHQGTSAVAADANARLSAQINSMLCASRFAHYLKVMGRDMMGSFQTPDAIERRLHAWLQGYVNTNTTSSGDARARFPLVAGDVQVRERPGRPGAFGCTIRLQPHHQLDGVAASFSLVTELTAPGGR